MIVIREHHEVIHRLGLDTLDGVDQFAAAAAERIKDQRGRRDVLRFVTDGEGGRAVTLFVKRVRKSRLKDGLRSLLSCGEVRSKSRVEFENYLRVSAAGVATACPVAFGEDVRGLRERFSFIITESAPGQDLNDWLRLNASPEARRRLLFALGRWVRDMHDRGVAFPDLFDRHIFIEQPLDGGGRDYRFALIDVARVDVGGSVSQRRRARDLAALNVSVPSAVLPLSQRVAFWKGYRQADETSRSLLRRVRSRAQYLLRRRKFAIVHPDAAAA